MPASQTAAAFLRGLDFCGKNQLDQAATQLALAAGPRREFFPAAFFLGAAYASVGRDRDAAGVWQQSMGADVRPTGVLRHGGRRPSARRDSRRRHRHPEARLRGPACQRRDRAPARDGVCHDHTVCGGPPILDAFLARHPTEQGLLLAAIVSQYEIVQGGQLASVEDVNKMRRYVTAYKGSESTLARSYLRRSNRSDVLKPPARGRAIRYCPREARA